LNTVCSVAVGVTLQLSARFSTIIMGKRPSYDALDVAVTLLKRREGIDKTMKLARYALILAVSEAETRARRDDSVLVSTSTAEFIRAGTALERSLGNARRALRLGKFLGNVAELRDVVREAEADGKRGWRRWASAAAACAALFALARSQRVVALLRERGRDKALRAASKSRVDAEDADDRLKHRSRCLRGVLLVLNANENMRAYADV